MTDPKLDDKIRNRTAKKGTALFQQSQIERNTVIENVKKVLEVLPVDRNTMDIDDVVKSREFKIGLVLQPMSTPPARVPIQGQPPQDVKKFLVRISTWVELETGVDEQKAIMATKFLTSVAFGSAVDVLAPVKIPLPNSLRKMSDQKSITTTEAMTIPHHVFTEVCFTYEIVTNTESKGKTKDITELLSDDDDDDDDKLAVEKLLSEILQNMLNNLGYLNQRFCGRKSLDCAGKFVARNVVCIRGDGEWTLE